MAFAMLLLVHLGQVRDAAAQLGYVARRRERQSRASVHIFGSRRRACDGHWAHAGHIVTHAAAHPGFGWRLGLSRRCGDRRLLTCLR
jgi:hypothetical protein